MSRLNSAFAAACALLIVLGGQGAALGAGPGGQGHAHPKGSKSEKAHHAHGEAVMIEPGPNAPTVSLAIKKDPIGGWNVHIMSSNFRFAPERSSTAHIDGEGHAHLYVNGKKIARVYGPWFHIGQLPVGNPVVRVTLNANDHRSLMVGGKVVAASQTVQVPGHTH